MNLWCKDTTVCAINSTFSVDFYTFYWANVCTVCPIRLQFILKMFHCMTTPSGIIDILETNLRIETLRFRIALITKQTYSGSPNSLAREIAASNSLDAIPFPRYWLETAKLSK